MNDFVVVKNPETFYETKKLLEECLYLLNEIPNKKYKPKTFKDSYELASEINKLLKKL